MALNQRRSWSRSGSVSIRPDFGVPAALIVCGVFSPGWHQPMRSKTAEKAPVSALVATTRSPISFAATHKPWNRSSPSEVLTSVPTSGSRSVESPVRERDRRILVTAHHMIGRGEHEPRHARFCTGLNQFSRSYQRKRSHRP